MLIGAHVSTAGGLDNALVNGLAIEAEALQIFPSPPQRWQIKGWNDEECTKFKAKWPQHFKQVIFHGIYLINLAGSNSQNLHLSKQALIDTLNLAPKLGITGVAFHPGMTHHDNPAIKQQIAEVIRKILTETPVETKLIFENSAGSTLGGRLEDLAWLMEVSGAPSRVGVCLDTCHAFAAGYNLADKEGYDDFALKVERIIGLDKVFAWHLNDSKFDLASKRDRHDNIGRGKLGAELFRWLLNDERWQNLAGYLEVPGLTNQGPDAANVSTLKSLRDEIP